MMRDETFNRTIEELKQEAERKRQEEIANFQSYHRGIETEEGKGYYRAFLSLSIVP